MQCERSLIDQTIQIWPFILFIDRLLYRSCSAEIQLLLHGLCKHHRLYLIWKTNYFLKLSLESLKYVSGKRFAQKSLRHIFLVRLKCNYTCGLCSQHWDYYSGTRRWARSRPELCFDCGGHGQWTCTSQTVRLSASASSASSSLSWHKKASYFHSLSDTHRHLLTLFRCADFIFSKCMKYNFVSRIRKWHKRILREGA